MYLSFMSTKATGIRPILRKKQRTIQFLPILLNLSYMSKLNYSLFMQEAARDHSRRPEVATGAVPTWAWRVSHPPPTQPMPLFSSSSSAAASSGFSKTATAAAPGAPSASFRFDPMAPSSSSSNQHHHHHPR
uniref:Uncharacterized protein n=1 Tax=Aegilops tauschii subsp. strangulata TaxID=200361 RepID=A0A452XSR5_AEGTS